VRTRAPRFVLCLVALAAAGTLGAPAATAADTAPPWRLAGDLRTLLAEAEKTLILEGPAEAAGHVEAARPVAQELAGLIWPETPAAAAKLLDAVDRAAAAAADGSGVALAAARAAARMAVYAGAYETAAAATSAGDVESARAWLLVREFRKPTRFSRPGADATLALGALANGTTTPATALAALRADLLDTYQARLHASLEAADQAVERGFATRAASEATLAAGYAGILAPAYREQRGAAAAADFESAAQALAEAGLEGDEAAYEEARAALDEALTGFRAAPLSAEEEERRAGQFLRFLALVPIEYGRGVDDGRVTLDFEIQEAITFRDGAAQAHADLESALAERDGAATARIGAVVDELGNALALAARGEQITDPDHVQALTDEALELADGIFPKAWKNTEAADFDVIRTSLDRVEGAVAAGEWGKAEQARLEAYAFFEFGPEQRLRGLAPELFVRVEGLFWYGEGDHAGLAQLIARRSEPEEVKETRAALDEALADAEAAVGSGPQSPFSVITNTAIIVFREGLEAVLILAALTAGMVGAQRRFRRPLLLGAAGALVASVATFVIAQTVLDSLTRYGEKLEAVVSLVAIAVLLLILNWFFHKVYWAEHLAGLHGKKKTLLRGAGLTAAAAQIAGLAMLGFSAVYREGFETVLFLQAIVLEAGVPRVIEGVALGLAGVAVVAVATIALQRKLPHRRMLELTGVLILAVLVVMVGKTVQVCQVVGWLPVHAVDGVRLPYWAGAWLGVFPTWEGIVAQALAVLLVVGSYVGAERMRTRRRRRVLEPADFRPVARVPEREAERVETPA
jgi:high-affinity iron transporter